MLCDDMQCACAAVCYLGKQCGCEDNYRGREMRNTYILYGSMELL